MDAKSASLPESPVTSAVPPLLPESVGIAGIAGAGGATGIDGGGGGGGGPPPVAIGIAGGGGGGGGAPKPDPVGDGALLKVVGGIGG